MTIKLCVQNKRKQKTSKEERIILVSQPLVVQGTKVEVNIGAKMRE